MPTIPLTLPALPARIVPILVDTNALNKLPQLLPSDTDGTVVLHDAALADVAARVSNAISAKGLIAVKSGESSKTLAETQRVVSEMLRLGATRKTVLVNVGGGMLTDLGGFVAAVFMRGIRYVHVPTSLLCMVDAAVGGKTGVDLEETKNIIGAIHHPLAVVCDVDLLKTLPDTPLREGLVETIKMAAMLDAEEFARLEGDLDAILQRDPAALVRCVAEAVRMKAEVVGGDEREDGRRMFLNFGHTVGHAVEAMSRFAIPHGQAVSIGMRAEMRLAGFADAERVNALMRRMGMPLAIPTEMDRGALWELMTRDKKNVGGAVRMAVPTSLGTGEIRTIERGAFLSLAA